MTRVELWKAQGTPSGNGVVSATLASTPSNAVIAVSRYSGVTALGNVVSANSLGVNGACTGGTDATSYSFNLTTTVNGAVAYGAPALRGIAHYPGSGYTERAEVHQGADGGSAAGVAVEDKTVATPASVAVNGTLGYPHDWTAIAVEVKP
jgi:hypothetical protein